MWQWRLVLAGVLLWLAVASAGPDGNHGPGCDGGPLSACPGMLELQQATAPMATEDRVTLQQHVRSMFHHAYGNYMAHAYPADELKPRSCSGRDPGDAEQRGTLDDVMGGYSLTLVDSLDMLVVLNDSVAFRHAVSTVQGIRVDRDVTVNVFETIIRGVGGLVSAHILALERPEWVPEYAGELLHLADRLARRLLPAFDTPTGIPYSKVNLRRGVDRSSAGTCLAGAGTSLLEFGALSRLTGDPVFLQAARKATLALWSMRSPRALLGRDLNARTAQWTNRMAGIGAGSDSFYEYLFKAYLLLGDRALLQAWKSSYKALDQYCNKQYWYLPVNYASGSLMSYHVDSLSAFWPGLQVLSGHVDAALHTFIRFYGLWLRFGVLPEVVDVGSLRLLHHSRGYPLRPELAESTYILWRSTRHPYFLRVAQQLVHSIERLSRVPCGYAAVGDVTTEALDDRMDSFFLSETLKYLYLTFADDDHWLHSGATEWIFTTEGHPLPLRAPLTDVRSVSDAHCHDVGPREQCVVPTDFDVEALHAKVLEVAGLPRTEDGAPTDGQPYEDSMDDGEAGGGEDSVRVVQQAMAVKRIMFVFGAHKNHMVHDSRAQTLIVQSPDPLHEGVIRLVGPSADTRQVLADVGDPASGATGGGVDPLQGGEPVLTYVESIFAPPVASVGGGEAVEARLVVGSPTDGCAPLDSAVVQDAWVVLQRGACTFVEKTWRAQNAGALGVIVVNNQAGERFAMSGDLVDGTATHLVTVPSVLVTMAHGRALQQHAGPTSRIRVHAAGPPRVAGSAHKATPLFARESAVWHRDPERGQRRARQVLAPVEFTLDQVVPLSVQQVHALLGAAHECSMWLGAPSDVWQDKCVNAALVHLARVVGGEHRAIAGNQGLVGVELPEQDELEAFVGEDSDGDGEGTGCGSRCDAAVGAMVDPVAVQDTNDVLG